MGVLTDTMQKNNKDIINEVEKINKTIERQQKNELLDRNNKQLLKVALTEYIATYYEENKRRVCWVCLR